MVLAAAASAGAAESAEKPELQWGPPAEGVRLAVEPVGVWRLRGPMRFRVHVASAAGAPVRLPPAAEAAGWLSIVQTFGDDRTAHYSRRFPMPKDGWPAGVQAEKPAAIGPFDAGPGQTYPREVRRQLLTAYLTGEGDLPKAAGPMHRVLRAGTAVIRFTLCLAPAGGKPAVVNSAATALDIAPPEMDTLTGADREQFLDNLMDQFNKDAWSGKQAHDTCVGLGAEVLPRVMKAAAETSRPAHARLWLATTLADIRDPRAAGALVRLLDDPSGGVRNVVAYHGPKQKSATLDAAIVRKASSGDAAGLAAWALLGFMVHRDTVPEKVLAAGLESRDPKARATAAEVLARHASDENVAHLVRLLSDENERVRGVAAKVLGHSNRPEPKVLGALVRALDRPGESARQRICQALSTLTDKKRLYDPTADEAARKATLAAWKAWWSARRSN